MIFNRSLYRKQSIFISGVIIVLLAGCASSATQSTSNPAQGTQTVGNQTVTLSVSARNMAFDKSTLSVPAGSNVTIAFNNLDSVPHNIAIYKTSEAKDVIFKGEVVTNKAVTYQFTAPSVPGNYFFRCDIHPTTMTGSFVVTAANQ